MFPKASNLNFLLCSSMRVRPREDLKRGFKGLVYTSRSILLFDIIMIKDYFKPFKHLILPKFRAEASYFGYDVCSHVPRFIFTSLLRAKRSDKESSEDPKMDIIAMDRRLRFSCSLESPLAPRRPTIGWGAPFPCNRLSSSVYLSKCRATLLSMDSFGCRS